MTLLERRKKLLLVAIAGALAATACSTSTTGAQAPPTPTTKATIPNPPVTEIPASIRAIMSKPRYAKASWSLLVTDLKTGEFFYALNPNDLQFTGSTRKLFSVGEALNQLGADHRETTPVHRVGSVDASGTLKGNLVLSASGDLTFGGRRIDADTVAVTNFDHNDAAGLGAAQLTPQDPLYALNQLAADVKKSGIKSVDGNVVIDDRLFTPYRVPNGNLLITPMMLNENMVDVTVTPTEPGQPAKVTYRPQTAAFAVKSTVMTTAPGTTSKVTFSDKNKTTCIGTAGCVGTVSGTIAKGYVAPLTKGSTLISTFRVENPNAFARTAFIEALAKQGVKVSAPAVGANPAAALPASSSYPADTLVGSYVSPPFSQVAKLVLKVSLNQGANLSLSLFGLTKGQRTIEGALSAERQTLTTQYSIDGKLFSFPTNGSGSPDSKASPSAIVEMLQQMSKTPVASDYKHALPEMGVDGSLATTGTTLAGKGHIFAKTGTTIDEDSSGTLQLKAQNLAGYIDAKGGRQLAYALMVNDAGPVEDIGTDVGGVFQDEAEISSIIYQSF